MNANRFVVSVAILCVGVISLLASSLEEPSLTPPPVAVTVSYTLSTSGDGFVRELDTRETTLSTALLSGSYASTRGMQLTLDRTTIDIDEGSTYKIDIAPRTASETLEGAADIELGEAVDWRPGSNPSRGQLISLHDGTTTVSNFSSSGVSVESAAQAARSFSWAEFVALANDLSADPDLRFAAAAYNLLPDVMQATLLGEMLARDVEDNRTTLEGMNLNSSLSLPCDNPNDPVTPSSRLLWTTDAAGTGQGTIGRGDGFEGRYSNCQRQERDRFLQGSFALENYIPNRDANSGSFAGNLQFSSLFVAEDSVDLDTVAGPESPRYTGKLSFSFTETPTVN